ncbi:carbonic anhydrase 1-like [Copidosoma floridanum]|uniref:carbonic anhydrase 1-like n=1 Tax=Copidosoma floridanum TaxID=29053 RepID=UPI0006C97C35|nr:carbonic anhydrase 1-like [Copidosoma floridanum]
MSSPFTVPDFIIYCISIILIAILLMEVLDWSCIQIGFACPSISPPQAFLYGVSNGPSYWRCAYPEARSLSQSPINIVGKSAIALVPSKPLCWRSYDDEPYSVQLSNDGNTVVLLGHWNHVSRPKLQGGPLQSVYDFHSAVFRWGPANDEGSEHTLDYVGYSMELQAMHLKRGIETPRDAAACKVKDGLAIVSYFFQITEADNPYLDHVVTNLWRVINPGSCTLLPAFPLEWLMPSFESKYYAYCGSLTHPPCSEIVTWIIQPRSIAISASQMAWFRKVCSTEGPITSNCRPVQNLNDRDVFYYC